MGTQAEELVASPVAWVGALNELVILVLTVEKPFDQVRVAPDVEYVGWVLGETVVQLVEGSLSASSGGLRWKVIT